MNIILFECKCYTVVQIICDCASHTAKYHVLRFVKGYLIHGPWIHTLYVDSNEDSKGNSSRYFRC